ncbi:hypothetical protein JOQ06_009999, partial [Pogonophryne albipinna]
GVIQNILQYIDGRIRTFSRTLFAEVMKWRGADFKYSKLPSDFMTLTEAKQGALLFCGVLWTRTTCLLQWKLLQMPPRPADSSRCPPPCRLLQMPPALQDSSRCPPPCRLLQMPPALQTPPDASRPVDSSRCPRPVDSSRCPPPCRLLRCPPPCRLLRCPPPCRLLQMPPRPADSSRCPPPCRLLQMPPPRPADSSRCPPPCRLLQMPPAPPCRLLQMPPPRPADSSRCPRPVDSSRCPPPRPADSSRCPPPRPADSSRCPPPRPADSYRCPRPTLQTPPDAPRPALQTPPDAPAPPCRLLQMPPAPPCRLLQIPPPRPADSSRCPPPRPADSSRCPRPALQTPPDAPRPAVQTPPDAPRPALQTPPDAPRPVDPPDAPAPPCRLLQMPPAPPCRLLQMPPAPPCRLLQMPPAPPCRLLQMPDGHSDAGSQSRQEIKSSAENQERGSLGSSRLIVGAAEERFDGDEDEGVTCLMTAGSVAAAGRSHGRQINPLYHMKRFELLTVNTAGLCVPHIPSWTNPPDRKSCRRSMCGVEEDRTPGREVSASHLLLPLAQHGGFSCWWRPLENLTEEVSYVLTYSKDKEPQQECPDYVSSGPNSCHFDKKHTIIWKFYCLNVIAVTKHGNYTSQKHCLDVADIVQMEAPVNLSFVLEEAGGDEMGHNALLSWIYPVPAHLKYGWITLEHELQYRRVSEPDVWKVKYPLREPQVELLGLPVGEFVVRVRCRSHNARLWSEWSDPLMMSIPARPPAGKLLSRRIKNFFLPPIPKPRIIGIDPLLLKKGNLDEINRHFSNFHSYTSPKYREEAWDAVSDAYLPTNMDAMTSQSHVTPVKSGSPSYLESGSHLESGSPSYLESVSPSYLESVSHLESGSPSYLKSVSPSYLESVSPSYLESGSPSYLESGSPLYLKSVSPPYCSLLPLAFDPPPEILSLPGTEYSIMGNPHPHPQRSPQDFYTCVQLMKDSSEVHLVPCLPPPYCQESQEEKKEKMADSKARTHVGEGGEAAVPLLPVGYTRN